MRAKILNASAGSGKTYQLAYKYVRDVVERPDLYRHILAVTFTNKATEEMKSRILREIHALASGGASAYLENLCHELQLDAATVRKRAKEVRSKILHDYSRFTVLTIDTFFQRILRAFIKELGIDLNYNVEIETAPVLTKSADTLIEQITSDADLKRWLTDFVQERIDEGKKWDIREGILALGGELFKERNRQAIARARSREELSRIVAVSSTQAAQTKERLQQCAAQAVRIMDDAGVSPADFTGKSRSFVHYFVSVAAGEIKPYTATVAKMSRTTEGWAPKGSLAESHAAQLQPLLLRLCALYDENIRAWNTADLLRENYRSFALLSDLRAKVRELCDEQNMMLLSETKHILAEFIGQNDAPFIYEKVGNRFERFMIDEFQDTSMREWENFLPLLQNAMSQSDAASVLLVGDIKQSIYRWRGGDWRLLHADAQAALGADTEVVNLRENWRSLPVVVDFNNRAIERVVEADNAALNQTLDRAVAQGELPPEVASSLHDTLRDAYRDHAQTPRRKGTSAGYVCVETFDERPAVVERVCEVLDKGFRPCDILILVRSATDGAKVAAELLDFKQRNRDPLHRFDVMTREALIVGGAPVSGFIAATLRLALSADDSLSRAVYNHFLGHAFDRQLTAEEHDFFHTIRILSPEEAFERIVMRCDLQHQGTQTAYLQAIHEQIIGFSATKVADIALFLDWWEQTGQNRSLSIEQSERTVEITTIHKAKGLEKPVVLIPYCAWQLKPKSGGNVTNIVWAEADEKVGRFPVKYKETMAASDFSADYYRETVYSHVDNVNLLYVALTRAAESLHVFIPQKKQANTVGELLLRNITVEGDKAMLATCEGCHTPTDEGERFEFGAFTGPAYGASANPVSATALATDIPAVHAPEAPSAPVGPEHILLTEYPTAVADLRLRLPSQRYFEEGEQVELSPRNLGILMHKAFSEADDRAQIDRAVAQMQADGTLSEAETTALLQSIARALENPVAGEWFDGTWQQVRNEHEIVVPQGRASAGTRGAGVPPSADTAGTNADNGPTTTAGTSADPGPTALRRPDRVMIYGDRVVVVDYKFGIREADRYRRQMREYLGLMRRMGYTRCEGYLWYVKLGNIEKVEENE